MAANKLAANVPGNFFVNDACINCDTCRQLAPETFAEIGNYSAVTRQPANGEEQRKANHALLSCPTAAIVSQTKEGLLGAAEDFPLLLENEVYYCGYTSSRSFGGSSYLISHPEGNWLVDSPRYVPGLVKKLELLGGIGTIFLTHQDDIADAAKYAAYFSADRIIHLYEKAAQPDAEIVIEGVEAVDWKPEFRIIPVPGHTKGHMVLLYKEKYLFTGDHLAWNREEQELEAFQDYCWYSWNEQVKSLERLAEESFEWILPGHGDRVRLNANEMKASVSTMLQKYKH